MFNLLKNLSTSQRIRYRFIYTTNKKFGSTNKNYYDVLGINSNSSKKEIKEAFYKLAKIYHPDINKGAEEKFKEINQAYEVLGDDGKRKIYDESLKYGNAYEEHPGYEEYKKTYTKGSQYYNQKAKKGDYSNYYSPRGGYQDPNFFSEAFKNMRDHEARHKMYEDFMKKQEVRYFI